MVTLKDGDEIEFFHFGDEDDSYGDNYDGIDMRSMVVMLSRNIKIEASKEYSYSLKDHWGCRVLVADFYEKDWSYQAGSVNFDYVEIYNCSQRYTFKPALAFEVARGG